MALTGFDAEQLEVWEASNPLQKWDGQEVLCLKHDRRWSVSRGKLSELPGWVLERCTARRIPACYRTGVWFCSGRETTAGSQSAPFGGRGALVRVGFCKEDLEIIEILSASSDFHPLPAHPWQTHIYLYSLLSPCPWWYRESQTALILYTCPMTPEGETVCLSLELWKHGENEVKYNVLGSCSLMVQISTASINSISSADPGDINIGESLTLSCVAACGRLFKREIFHPTPPPPFFHRILKNAKKKVVSLWVKVLEPNISCTDCQSAS